MTKTIHIAFKSKVKLGELLDALADFDRDAEVLFSDSYEYERPIDSVIFVENGNQIIFNKSTI